MSPRVMSLFSGYGGLDLGFEMVCPDAETVYVSDIEEGPCRVLAAPAPTILSDQGNPQLSHYFTEWMMGLPDGWITNPALWEGYTDKATRNVCLRMAGNGVVPLQAATAINHLTHLDAA